MKRVISLVMIVLIFLSFNYVVAEEGTYEKQEVKFTNAMRSQINYRKERVRQLELKDARLELENAIETSKDVFRYNFVTEKNFNNNTIDSVVINLSYLENQIYYFKKINMDNNVLITGNLNKDISILSNRIKDLRLSLRSLDTNEQINEYYTIGRMLLSELERKW